MELLLKEGEAQDEKERRLEATEANGQSRVIRSRLARNVKSCHWVGKKGGKGDFSFK